MHVYSGTVGNTSKELCHVSTEFGTHFILDVSCDLRQTISTVHNLGETVFKAFSSGIPIHLPHTLLNIIMPSINTHAVSDRLQSLIHEELLSAQRLQCFRGLCSPETHIAIG